MTIVKSLNVANPIGWFSRRIDGNKVFLSIGVLSILVGILLASVVMRTTMTRVTMPFQSVTGALIIKPMDGIESQSSSAATVAIGDLVFAERDTVWMQNYKGELLITRDGGMSWLPVGGTVAKEFDAFTMIDGVHGWAVESENKIWRTEDSGQNWNLISALPQDPELHYSASQIIFNGRDNGWIIGIFNVWRSRDAGLSWNKVDEFSYRQFKNRVRGMYFLDSRIGWAICEEGLVIQTNDGGDHWRSIVEGLPFNVGTTVNAARFLDEKRGWISIRDASNPFPENVVLNTEDGGKTWRPNREIGSDVVIHDIFFLNDKMGWTVGGIKKESSGFETGVLFATEDGGKTWRRIKTAPTDDGINSVRFTSPEEGWLTTDYSVYRTHDGGKTWSSVLSYPEVKRRNEKILGN